MSPESVGSTNIRSRQPRNRSSLSQPKHKLTQKYSSLTGHNKPFIKMPILHPKINGRQRLIKEKTIIKYISSPNVTQSRIYQNKMKQFEKAFKHRPTLQFRNQRKNKVKLKPNNIMKKMNINLSNDVYLTPDLKKSKNKTSKLNHFHNTEPSKSTTSASVQTPDEGIFPAPVNNEELKQNISFENHQDPQNPLFPPIMPFNFNGMNVGFCQNCHTLYPDDAQILPVLNI
jgi:hypothetical protein